MTTLLLASVRSAEEAEAAVTLGAEIVDLKDSTRALSARSLLTSCARRCKPSLAAGRQAQCRWVISRSIHRPTLWLIITVDTRLMLDIWRNIIPNPANLADTTQAEERGGRERALRRACAGS
jgi:hypothetical protein